jgi:predicted  nucleic acid-binding Zn-ribbon protein
MTIDERLEKLTERHEALTQTMELHMAAWDKQQIDLNKKFASIGESLEKLANIVLLHQHRLDSHEDRLDTLEGTA